VEHCYTAVGQRDENSICNIPTEQLKIKIAQIWHKYNYVSRVKLQMHKVGINQINIKEDFAYCIARAVSGIAIRKSDLEGEFTAEWM